MDNEQFTENVNIQIVEKTELSTVNPDKQTENIYSECLNSLEVLITNILMKTPNLSPENVTRIIDSSSFNVKNRDIYNVVRELIVPIYNIVNFKIKMEQKIKLTNEIKEIHGEILIKHKERNQTEEIKNLYEKFKIKRNQHLKLRVEIQNLLVKIYQMRKFITTYQSINGFCEFTNFLKGITQITLDHGGLEFKDDKPIFTKEIKDQFEKHTIKMLQTRKNVGDDNIQ